MVPSASGLGSNQGHYCLAEDCHQEGPELPNLDSMQLPDPGLTPYLTVFPAELGDQDTQLDI